jgi:hypothetical protein
MTIHDDYKDQTEAAIAQRLAKLSTMPVDTTNLDRALRKQLPSPPASSRRRWWMSITGVAASLLLIVTVALFMLTPREAQASYSQMAQMHQDIVSGKIPTMRASSIDEANQAIAAMSGDFPKLPHPPAAHTMACCMRNIGKKKVACVLLENGTTPVTMVVANAADVESPKSPVTLRDGIAYHVKAVGNLNMVMTEREHRWICLISSLPSEKLMDLADGIKF